MEDPLEGIPDYFLCPITREVMEYPFATAAGNSYEYEAIRIWLSKSDTDPKSGQILPSKHLIPNHTLRAHILSWFDENPSKANLRNSDTPRPPQEAYDLRQDGLDQFLLYRGKSGGSSTGKRGAQKEVTDLTLPESFTAFGHTYTFKSLKRERGPPAVMISCDNGRGIEMPDRFVFATSKGLVFYDPKETRDVLVLPGTEKTPACKFKASCNRNNCSFAHPFVCLQGVSCTRQGKGCKFFHPPADSVQPVTGTRKKDCKYGTSCLIQKCGYAHPKGRLDPREKARILVTHSHTLEEYSSPLELGLNLPGSATCFQMQGEFVCSFQPYSGPWAKHHFKIVTVHRFVPSLNAFKAIGNYSLKDHYCNCAVAAGRYMIFSFWPFEDEAMRTIWDCLKVTRAQEKELKEKDKALKAKIKECQNLEQKLEAKDRQVQNLNQTIQAMHLQVNQIQQELQYSQIQTQEAKEELQRARQEARESESYWRQLFQTQERDRNERLRMRDPIHIYALQDGTSGMSPEDWELVIDYHKGAHSIEIGQPRPDGTQALQLRVNKLVFHFDLVGARRKAAPSGPNQLMEWFGSFLGLSSSRIKLPLTPAVLCPDF